MANDTAFSILNEFGDDTLKRVASQPQGGFVQYSPVEKDPVNVAVANQDYENEEYFDIMSDYLTGTYIPVKTAGELEFQQQFNALGLGKKYSPQQFKSTIEQYIGEIPKASTTDKALRFLFDSLNAKTPFIGTAGVFDVLSQAAGKYLDREENQKALELQRNLQIGELAVKQAADANENLFLKEAELRNKMLGHTYETQKSMLNFDEEVRMKLLGFDKDVELDRIKTSNSMLQNLQKAVSMNYTTDGKTYQPTAVQLRLTDDGNVVPFTPKMVEQPDGSMKLEFTEGPPEGTTNFYFTTSVADPAESSKTASTIKPSASQFQEAQNEYLGLKTAGNLVEQIILENNASVAANKGYTVGLQGTIDKLKQGFRLTGAELLNEIKSNNGVSLGESIYQFGQSKMKDQKNLALRERQGEDVYIDTDFEVLNKMPITIEKFSRPNGAGSKSEVTLGANRVSLDNLLDPNWYMTNYNYNPVYAKNVVREKIIAYALARGLKSTGRLNVDDLQQAREATQLYGFVAAPDVITRLNIILDTIRAAQVNSIEALRFGENVDLSAINPDIKKDFNLLKQYIDQQGKTESLYEQVILPEQPGDIGNNQGAGESLTINPNEQAESLDINSWTGGSL
tara:strand:+ start:1168 stop:3039 length:1872 start_codon:yes stop_codon:yes gene_type:complete